MTTLEPLLRELIGGALRRRRREHGRTLTDVAGQAGVRRQHRFTARPRDIMLSAA